MYATTDRDLLIRYGFLAGAALALLGLGFFLGRLTVQPQEPVAQTAVQEPASESSGKIFSQGVDTRRMIAALPLNYGWASHRGKHEVALDLTIANNNAAPVKDIELLCSFFSKKQNAMGTRKGVIAETIEANGSKTFTRVPVPQMPDSAANVNCEILDAKLIAPPPEKT